MKTSGKMIIGIMAASIAISVFAFLKPGTSDAMIQKQTDVTKLSVASALSSVSNFSILPASAKIEIEGITQDVGLNYGFELTLQSSIQNLFDKVRPDFGAFVAVDAETGKIISMVSFAASSRDLTHENLALKASFPAASVFKVVTAAAAIAEKNFQANSTVQFNGSDHTLYRSNILKTLTTRYTRTITLKDAFARSVNTVFGRLGVYSIGAIDLKQYASRFGFNRQIASDVPIQIGRVTLKEDAFNLAETASGFNQTTTMSPLQGALIAAAVANQGVMMEPYAIESVTSFKDGKQLYKAQPKLFSQAVTPRTAEEIQKLMRETITFGTSKKAFRGFFRGSLWNVDVGGKTGSLTGTDPKGKYDWFVGFATRGKRKIAIASLTINRKHWKIKSSQIARYAIENIFLRESLVQR